MSSTRKTWKLQDFVAHAANVTCLAIGPTSGRVMVTGGEDRKVNMWAVGQPNVIMSLSGHTTPIQCVKFNTSEELVVAGSQSGSLKIWDLEAAKIVRTLTGHKSNVQCLDFHPYGDFVASGSLDTNVKLWDVRRKGCIFTYKGHTDAVNSLRFSPDGRWVISAGEDSLVKLWDLTAGRILNEFVGHTAAVNCIEFHPKEFLMASGGSDRMVKFWDLETFDLVASSIAEQSAIRCVKFSPDGNCLFTASQDSLRAYGWEPLRCYDSQTVGWGKVSDCSFSSEQLIGASFSHTNVSVWVVDLQYIKTTVEAPQDDGIQSTAHTKDPLVSVPKETASNLKPSAKPSPSRKSFDTRPTTSSSKARKANLNQTHDVEEPLSTPFASEGGDKYEEAFRPRQNLARSPRLSRKNAEPFKAPQEMQSDASATSKALASEVQIPTTMQVTATMPSDNEHAKRVSTAVDSTHAVETDAAQKLIAQQQQQLKQQQELLRQQQQQQLRLQRLEQEQLERRQQEQQQALQKPSSNHDDRGLLDSHPLAKDQTSMNRLMSEDDVLAHLHKDHMSFCSIMDSRLKNLSLVGRLWTDGEIKVAVETATVMPDPAILIDLLNVLLLKQALWNLDICVVVLPQLIVQLDSKHESYVETAANCLKLVLKNFAPVIKSNMAAPPASLGVDLVREERFEKCQQCQKHLFSIRNMVSQRTQASGRPGNIYRQLAVALGSID